ncbi:Hypothetical protein precursor [Bosea sp. LC85]|uniref:DUF1254 domain-containing protein n=1 Tax=Bosea sp. LC85 TaxID=1502851 RepID=UPI0004E41600|nr:DUF1254 domain-containing protein [Bosea sp. LC85]KFC66846.1 Hypothetical protein precursor [Bosea sp. LC85]
MRSLLISVALLFVSATGHAQAPDELTRRMLERRAVEAVIWGIPAVNTDLMRQEMLTKTSGKVGQVIYWGRPLDSRNQTLTPNPDALYFMSFFDLRDGPVVLDLPRADGKGSFNANIVTVWQMPLEDAGLLGVDKGKGGKFLLLPPGYKGEVPKGYYALKSDTMTGYMLFRSNFASHSDADVQASIAYGKRLKVYPLAQAAKPPATAFIDVKGDDFDSTIRYNASFFENLNRVVQAENWIDRDRVMIDQLRSLGIEKGKPFNPSDGTKALMDAAVKEAGTWLEARYDAGLPPFFSDRSRWTSPAYPTIVKAYSDGLADPNAYPVDDRGVGYSYAYIGLKRLGAGQFYSLSIRDRDGDAFDGAKTYRLRVPPNAPVAQYWSVTAYDRQTHALIKGMPHASRSSQGDVLKKNSDGSIDIFIGPKAPLGKENNWLPTDPGRKFELLARFYAPKKEFFEKKWILPDAEKVSQ